MNKVLTIVILFAAVFFLLFLGNKRGKLSVSNSTATSQTAQEPTVSVTGDKDLDSLQQDLDSTLGGTNDSDFDTSNLSDF